MTITTPDKRHNFNNTHSIVCRLCDEVTLLNIHQTQQVVVGLCNCVITLVNERSNLSQRCLFAAFARPFVHENLYAVAFHEYSPTCQTSFDRSGPSVKCQPGGPLHHIFCRVVAGDITINNYRPLFLKLITTPRYSFRRKLVTLQCQTTHYNVK